MITNYECVRQALIKAKTLLELARFESLELSRERLNVLGEIHNALKMPRRNCDVGSAMERVMRHKNECVQGDKCAKFRWVKPQEACVQCFAEWEDSWCE